MISRRNFAVGAGFAALPLLGGCGSFLFPSRYRFRMTVEVATPQGLKSGSSVMEISAARQILGTSEAHPISAGLRGEAVVVDLLSGPIFALLTIRWDSGPLLLNVVTDALNPLDVRGPTTDDYMRQIDELATMPEGARKAELARDYWPKMMRFRDLTNAWSLELLDPDVIGVKRVIVAVTQPPMTTGIERRLPRLAKGVFGMPVAFQGKQTIDAIEVDNFIKGKRI